MTMDPALFQENERTAPTHAHRRHCSIETLPLESGGRLDGVTVAYETWGVLNPARENAVLVCHALSGDSHCVGWWSRLVGPGRAIDTDRYFVIGQNALGGCQGTTGPQSLHPNDGRPYGSRFPAVTVRDMVDAQVRLLDHLGIERLAMVAGGSMGAMQALEWTLRAPHRVVKAWLTAGAAAHSALQIGFNEAARQAIQRDPQWFGGDYSLDAPPVQGLAVARMIGHLGYLSEAAFDAKFGRTIRTGTGPDAQFEVASYLNYQGDKFTARFDANSLLVLTRAIDAYACTSLEGSQAQYLVTSFTSDWLYPVHQSETVHRLALAAGRPSRHSIIEHSGGHDAFLLDDQRQADEVRQFLDGRST